MYFDQLHPDVRESQAIPLIQEQLESWPAHTKSIALSIINTSPLTLATHLLQIATQVEVRIGYCGPGLSGKTSSLRALHASILPEHHMALESWHPENAHGDMLRFTYSPKYLSGLKHGTQTVLHLERYRTNLPQDHHLTSWQKSLDGVVFVADSQAMRAEANLLAWSDFFEARTGLELDGDLGALENALNNGFYPVCPVVFQVNKRDLPTAVDINELRKVLDPKERHPWFESCALDEPLNLGVSQALKYCLQACLSPWFADVATS